MKTLSLITFFAVAVVLGAQSLADASSLVVTSLGDTGAAGQLRSAITTANGSPGSTITFQNNLAGTITLTRALPTITTTMTIAGPGPSLITVDGAEKYTPFTSLSCRRLRFDLRDHDPGR